MTLVKEWLLDIAVYEPRDYGENSIRLDMNENPYPPLKCVVDAALRELSRANRYPERKLYTALIEALEQYTGVKAANIVVGGGSDSILKAVFEATLEPGDVVVHLHPTFSMYPIYSAIYRGNTTSVELKECGERWCIPFEELLSKSGQAKLVVIDNPNNPTGSLLVEPREVEELLQSTNALVVVDEAYFEYSGVTAAGLVESYDNLVVVRTFSKAFGLAGFRVGYALASRRLVKVLKLLLTPFPVSRPSLAAATAALSCIDEVKRRVTEILRMREELRGKLRSLGFKPYKSWTNFVLVKTSIEDVVGRLERLGILVRRVPMGSRWMRVSVGSQYEISKLISVLEALASS